MKIIKKGHFYITPRLTDFDKYYLTNFSYTPHYKRDNNLLTKYYHGRNGYNGDYGREGSYFIKNLTNINGDLFKSPTNIDNNDIKTILNYGTPPIDQPGKYCPWIPDKTGTSLIQRKMEKSYNNDYGWLKWLIKFFFKKHKYLLNGEFIITTSKSKKIISIIDNKISIKSINNKINISTSQSSSLTINNNFRTNILSNREIVNNIINETISNKIQWGINKNNMYSTSINIEYNIDIRIYIKILKDSIYTMNIYLKKTNSTIHIKNISDRELIHMLYIVINNQLKKNNEIHK